MITFENITKQYGSALPSVSDISLEIGEGELMVLVGPSGSGKSTLLKLTAGLLQPTAGRIIIDGRDVTDLAPQDRDIAMVFQNYALYPHMTVRQNLEFGLRVRKVPAVERASKVVEAAAMLGITELLDRRPAALSGGERQRVAMGRAIVREPSAFLLDEPLSNLDAQLRVRMRAELAQIRDTLKTTTIYVTHDQVEAMTLGHRVAVLRNGTLQQVGTGRELFDAPANRFVASFIGSPPMNFFSSALGEGGVTFGGQDVPLRVPVDLSGHVGGNVVIGVRPQAFEADSECQDRGLPRVRVHVSAVEELGAERMVLFRPENEPTGGPIEAAYQARVSNRADVRPDAPAVLAVDPAAFYFFHPDDERTLAHPERHALQATQPGIDA